MGQLLLFPRKTQPAPVASQPEPDYVQGSLVFAAIAIFCFGTWAGVGFLTVKALHAFLP